MSGFPVFTTHLNPFSLHTHIHTHMYGTHPLTHIRAHYFSLLHAFYHPQNISLSLSNTHTNTHTHTYIRVTDTLNRFSNIIELDRSVKREYHTSALIRRQWSISYLFYKTIKIDHIFIRRNRD